MGALWINNTSESDPRSCEVPKAPPVQLLYQLSYEASLEARASSIYSCHMKRMT